MDYLMNNLVKIEGKKKKKKKNAEKEVTILQTGSLFQGIWQYHPIVLQF